MKQFIFISLCFTLCLTQDPATRAQNLVNQMTSDEKYSMLNGVQAFANNYYVGNIPAISRLSIPSLNLQDSPQGFRTTDSRMYGQVTSWSCSLGVVSTWDTNLVNQWAVAMGQEFRAKGANVILGPGLNFNRVARGGRNAEYLTGEDPYFGSEMVTAYVKGIQSQKVMANMKHFALNNQETNRDTMSANVDERTLWEIYYPAYQAGSDAGCASAMCSYNLINGTHSCGNSKNLNTDLKGAMGFQGWVMSDWDAAHGTWATDGLDQDMPGDDGYYSSSNLAKVDNNTINNMVYRILLSFITSGSFDSPVCNTANSGCSNYLYSVNATSSAHVSLARTIAAQSAQLLQNNNNVLPLTSLPAGATIAVVGSACNSPNDIPPMTNDWDLGNYYVVGGSGRVISPYTVPILQGIQTRAQQLGFKVVSDTSDNVQNSINLIQSASVGILCGATTSAESKDRPNLSLDQDSFITNVLSNTSKNSNLKTVVLMQTPGPVLTNWRGNTNAILNMFLAGQETGNAWADVLFGDVNPSGKLPITLPLSESDTIPPCTASQCPYSEGLNVGYRGFNGKQVAFPFGHGLSYTTFDFAWDAKPATTGCSTGLVVCMRVSVTNTGNRSGATVAQIYLDYPTSAGEPATILRGFQKTSILNAGQNEIFSFGLTAKDVSIYNVTAKGWSRVSGTFTIYAGASSRDHTVSGQVTL